MDEEIEPTPEPPAMTSREMQKIRQVADALNSRGKKYTSLIHMKNGSCFTIHSDYKLKPSYDREADQVVIKEEYGEFICFADGVLLIEHQENKKE